MNPMKRAPLLASCLALGTALVAAESARPNVLVILTDDQGYADLGVQGLRSEVKTPHLDALAAGGVRCTAGYVTAPQCSPSRAGLLTGRYQQRFGFDDIAAGPLPEAEMTLAERLTAVGYRCGFVGKWHLDPGPMNTAWLTGAGAGTTPAQQRGRFGPQAQGFASVFWGQQQEYWSGESDDLRTVTTQDYRTEAQTDAALAFLKTAGPAPFYLHLCYFSPHTPLEAPNGYLQRFPATLPERRRLGLAMLAAIDDGVGRIVAALRASGKLDNTLVVFVSDNGAPLKHAGTSITDGNIASCNEPLMGEKGMLSEGGIRVPMIWHYPAKLPAGRVHAAPVSTLDLVPTALSAAGVQLPADLDGRAVTAELAGEAAAPRDLYWRFWRQAAIRRGDWKLLRLADGRRFLFDLANDVGERRDRSAAEPARLAELDAALEAWLGSLPRESLVPGSKAMASALAQVNGWYDRHFAGIPGIRGRTGFPGDAP
jgi:arylsulfatase A-like enzyme